MMRVLIRGGAPWHPTGYGRHTAALARCMRNDGLAVAVVDANCQKSVSWEGIPVFSGSVREHCKAYRPNVLLTLVDMQYFESDTLFTPGVKTCIVAMIDGWPVSDTEIMSFMQADALVCPSKWGQQELNNKALDAAYIPLGIDPDVYFYDQASRLETRKQLGCSADSFLIGMVGRNYASSMKGFGFALEAIAAMSNRNIKAYIHTDPSCADGMDLLEIRETLGLGDIVMFPPSNEIDESSLRGLYSAFDVILQPSRFEGFGLPVIEAQACGTPVVVNAATSLSELVREGVAADPLGSEFYRQSRISIPSVPNLIAGLEQVCAKLHSEEDRLQLQQRIANEFSWDKIYQTKWKPLLAELS